MAQGTFRIRVVRGDFEFEAEGDKKFVLDMLNRFDSTNGEQPHPRRAGQRRSAPSSAGKSLSAREFIQKLGLKKHTDIGLAFGYYIEKNLGRDDFTPADINNCYYEAKMEPSNTSQVIIQNMRFGRIMEAKKPKGSKSNRKTYVLTTTGEEFISKKLSAASS